MAIKFEEVTVVLENEGDFYRAFIKAMTADTQRYAISKYFHKCFPDETCTPTRIDLLYDYFRERWLEDNVVKVDLPVSLNPPDLVIKTDGNHITGFGAVMSAKKLVERESIRMTKERAKPDECDCCGFATDELRLFVQQDTTIAGGGKTRMADFWFCDLCCSTPTSAYNRYPGQSPSNTDILKTICYVGNEILKEIKGRS